MEQERYNFNQYKQNNQRRWQKKILKLGWSLAFLILAIEIYSYTTLLMHGERVDSSFSYVLLRIITPSLLNFGSLLTATLLSSKKISVEKINHATSMCLMIIAGVLSIFHNFFQLLLIAPAFIFFICASFGETKILKLLLVCDIPIFILTCISFWTDNHSGEPAYKALTLVCCLACIIFSYIYARSLMKSQAKQFEYIHESYKKQNQLIEELKIEPMTKLYNRTAMDETISRIINLKKSESINPFLVIMDIDFFKKVNDKYGHTAGDEVLITLADIIKKNIGSSRRAFRFGGEEFVLIFEDNMAANVIFLVQSIREEFSNTRFDFAPNSSFTLSAGISLLHSSFDEKDWIDSADKCLYFAKNNGRNQVKVAELEI